jgi:1-aminocyclopropane-1-carboxylate deaminase/D-cysteine desulfhydrase-like pyridoxal-dependent ACC family enzyme
LTVRPARRREDEGVLADALAALPRARLATLPTPLEPGPRLPGGARLWVKRDDLTGLGMGGNKARKLEYLCGQAVADGADTLVTVGAAQSNHCRTTAAAGAVLGLDVHLVVGGPSTTRPSGNQLLSGLFGAHAHHPGTDDWAELSAAMDGLVADLERAGRRPVAIPLGGSTPLGAAGFAAAMAELVVQCEAAGIRPRAVVHTTSSGGTQAGLVAGRAAQRAEGRDVPDVVAVGVAKGVVADPMLAARLARSCLGLLGLDPGLVADDDVAVLDGFMGPDYGVPTEATDAAIAWAARRGAWVLDRVYTGKGFAGLLALAEQGRWAADDDVVFWHTGGQPAVFAPGGAPGVAS